MKDGNLQDNEKRPIVKIGNEVHRPTYWWTESVHDLLNHLASVKFDKAPKVLGFDDEGREVVSYIDGQSGRDGWFKIHSDEGLANFARLLREFHNAVASFQPKADSKWAFSNGTPKPGEIMCHGDFGPWNIVWDGNTPIGIVDWDLVLPAKPQFDILYALEYSAPFRDDEAALRDHHFDYPPDRKHRIEVFLEAYGPIKLGDIVTGVAEVQRQTGRHEKILADKGLQPQVDWVAEGDLDKVEERAKWTETNRHLFE